MNLVIRPMEAGDLDRAREIYRAAFASFLKVPAEQLGDADVVGARFKVEGGRAFIAEADGEVLGSQFAEPRGSVAGVGPVTLRPTGWTGNAGKRLFEAALAAADGPFAARFVSAYTFAQSPPHLTVHQHLGFWPRFLTAHLAAPVRKPTRTSRHALYGELGASEQDAARAASRALTDSLFAGLDWSGELAHLARNGLGDTVLLPGGAGLDGFAACHLGSGSEAGTGKAYVKFAAVRGGEGAAARFESLLDGVLALAHARGLKQVVVGCNTAREEAYRALLARGFVVTVLGAGMARPNIPAYMAPGFFVLDDGR